MRSRLLFVLVGVAACGGGGGSSDIPEACNPLGGQGCMLPWPSMAYAKEDASSPTGYRLAIPREAMPVNADGIVVEPDTFNRWDGFSAVAPMLAIFPTGVSAAGLPTWKDPEASLKPDSPIVLVNVESGERVPLFAEVDQNTVDVNKRALIIRPLARLKPKSHYAVGIRNTVKAADGTDLVRSEGFEALVDGKGFSHPLFDKLKKTAPAMLAALETAGLPKTEMALAWDFVTVSDEFLRSDLTAMREQALPAIGTAGANLTFTATAQSNTPQTYKRYLGTFKSPNFLTAGEMDSSVFVRDADHKPQMTGMRDAKFAAVIPSCVTTAQLPIPTVVFGHGLFGSSQEYLSDDFVIKLANDNCLNIIAGDFIGLTSRQLALAPLSVNDLNRGPQIVEKLGQSIIDFIALESITRGPMANAPEFKLDGTGPSVIDPARTYYIGGSLGGIMGNVFMAYDPNITKGVLAVPGGNWSLLFERSNAWHLLMGAAQGAYENPEVYQLNLAMALGMGFEPYDPITTAAHVTKDPLFGQPAKNILIWYAVGDCLVTNIATEMIAREMGLQMTAPTLKTPFGITTSSAPLVNGITIYDEHPTPMPFDTNEPPKEDNGTHGGVNKNAANLRQVQQFLLQNQVVDECKVANAPAPCDCATGACD
jgi:pimeloyl-ACP methyl ester carboxylesterase